MVKNEPAEKAGHIEEHIENLFSKREEQRTEKERVMSTQRSLLGFLAK